MNNRSLLFWILALAVLLVLLAKFYGKKGVVSGVCLGGILLTKDAIGHFWGQTAKWIFTGLFLTFCVAIYVVQRRSRGQAATHERHLKSERDQTP
jgi:hypothetical protein